MKFLIDECLSPLSVDLALEAGCAESTHVTWRGRGAARDWAVARCVVGDGFVLVTDKGLDFLRPCGREACMAAWWPSTPRTG